MASRGESRRGEARGGRGGKREGGGGKKGGLGGAYHDEGFARERDAVLVWELGHEGPVALDELPLRQVLLRSWRTGARLSHLQKVSVFDFVSLPSATRKPSPASSGVVASSASSRQRAVASKSTEINLESILRSVALDCCYMKSVSCCVTCA